MVDLQGEGRGDDQFTCALARVGVVMCSGAVSCEWWWWGGRRGWPYLVGVEEEGEPVRVRVRDRAGARVRARVRVTIR